MGAAVVYPLVPSVFGHEHLALEAGEGDDAPLAHGSILRLVARPHATWSGLGVGLGVGVGLG